MQTAHTLLIVLTIIALVGCEGSRKPTTPEQRSDSKGPFDYTTMVSVSQIAPAFTVDQRPTTAEQLRDDFTSILKTQPEKALIDFVDWDSVPESERKRKLGELLTIPFTAGREEQHELLDSKLYTITEYCNILDSTPSEYNDGREIEITHFIELHYKTAHFGTLEIPMDVGERDGRFYLYPQPD